MTFIDDQLLRVGDTDFHCDFSVTQAPAGRVPVMKPRPLAQRYIDLFRDFRPAVIVELGIHLGGGAALLHELARPTKLIAVEIATHPAAALTEYIAQRGLEEVVRPYYGVDQADPVRLTEILDAELDGRPIDLVIDDASHLYIETLSSFETLFPRLVPGGLFVIEDWNGLHLVGDAIAHALNDPSRTDHAEIRELVERQPEHGSLTRLAIELVLARASSGDVMRSVLVNSDWILVERGEDDATSFRVADHVHDHFGMLANP